MSKPLTSIDLFAGIGGFALASRWLGIKTTQFVEINLSCQKILAKNFPDIHCHYDVRTYHPKKGSVDLIVGGSPCQDLSSAGKQKGIIHGIRSSLWFEQLRIYRESGATFLVWENVMGAFRNGFAEVLRSLSESGYDAEWQTISASCLGAPHARDRLFLVAYPTGLQFQGEPSPWSDTIRSQVEAAATYPDSANGEAWSPDGLGNSASRKRSTRSTNTSCWASTEPPVCGVAHGFPNRLDRLSGLGNAVIPQCAAVALMRVQYLSSLLGGNL